MRVLELYAGIGGVAATGVDVASAIDHDPYAHAVYTDNWPHPALRLNLTSVRAERLRSFGADTWWLSPPCQPFTVRGARRDVDDRRCESFLHLLDVLQRVRPARVVVENVPGFEGSVAHARLRHALADWHQREVEWCPSQLGLPVQRRRFYLLASTQPFEPALPQRSARPLADFLDPVADPREQLEPAFRDRFGDALHVVDADDPDAVACCFTGAYGRSPVYAGSYLRQRGVVRRFSPGEIARLHGFPDDFRLPEERARAYKLLGNGLSVDVAAAVLRALTADAM